MPDDCKCMKHSEQHIANEFYLTRTIAHICIYIKVIATINQNVKKENTESNANAALTDQT